MRFNLTSISAALLASLFAQAAMASGYHFGSQSASAQGTANANAAEAEDASVLFYNPAGLSRLKGFNASGVLTVVMPSGKYEDRGSTTVLGRPLSGDSGKFVNTTAVPHGYLSYQLSDSLVAGFGVFVPFGSKSEYNSDWAGRYNTIGTELKTIALNPSLSFKVNEQWSLGGGITAQYIEGKLSKAADFGSGVLGDPALKPLLGALPPAMVAGLIQKMSGTNDFSGRVDVEGKNWGYGFNLGLMYSYDKDTRFGVAYRSKIKHQLSGDARWQVQTPATNIAAALNGIKPGLGSQVQAGLVAKYSDSDASLDVVTPESLSLSAFKQMDKLALMADLTLTRHSRFQELRVDFANKLPDSVTPENWTNTVRYSVGMNYQLNEQFKLRAGVAYDGSPVSTANRTPSLPDNDRLWLSGGLNWKLSPKNSVDLALSYVKVGSSDLSNADYGGQASCRPDLNTSSCATIRGHYDISSILFGVQYNHQF